MKKHLLKLTLVSSIFLISSCAHFTHNKNEGRIVILENEKEGYASINPERINSGDKLEVFKKVCETKRRPYNTRAQKSKNRFVCKDIPKGSVLATRIKSNEHFLKVESNDDLILEEGFIIKEVK